MGLGDFTDDKKEEFDEVDQDELQELIAEVDEYTERVERLLRIAVNLDGRVEEIQDDVSQLNRRIKRIENNTETDPDDSQSTDNNDEEETFAWE